MADEYTSDEKRIATEYLLAMAPNRKAEEIPDFMFDFTCSTVRLAMKEEPRISCGLHIVDWMLICDEEDDFDSFYGPNYFERPPVAIPVATNITSRV